MLSLLPIAAMALAPRTIVVAPAPAGEETGTGAHPFTSIQRACDEARMGDTVLIRPGTYRQAVRLTSSGQYFGRQITIQADGAVLDGDGINLAGPLFDTGGQDHLIIRGLTVRQAPVQGIGVVASYRVTIENCRVEGARASGIFIDKSHDVHVTRCDVSGACSSPDGEESVSIKRSAYVVFEDSAVHDTGHEGIDVKEESRDVLVRGNRVFNVERQGLYADAWDGDTGWVRYENNVIHNCMVGLVACTETGGLLHDVAFVGNVVYDCRGPGMMLAKWGDQSRTHHIRNVSYINNTVVHCGGKSPNSGHLWAGGLLLENDQAENVTIANNLLSQNPFAQLTVTLNMAPKGIRMFDNLIDGPGPNITKGNLVANPRFSDAAKKDFRLAPGSAGLGQGKMLPELPKLDAAGQPRVRNGKVDIGAFER